MKYILITIFYCVLYLFLNAFLFKLCDIKFLPWSYCGELTGLINIVVTSMFLTLLIALINIIKYVRNK